MRSALEDAPAEPAPAGLSYPDSEFWLTPGPAVEQAAPGGATGAAPEDPRPEQDAEQGEALPEPSPHQAPWYMARRALGTATVVTVHPGRDQERRLRLLPRPAGRRRRAGRGGVPRHAAGRGLDRGPHRVRRTPRRHRDGQPLQLQGPRGILRVQAPSSLYGMLPVEREPEATGTYRLADGLEESLPDIFGDTVPAGAAVVRPADSGVSAPAPQEQPVVPRSARPLSIQPRLTDTFTFDAPDGVPAETLEQLQHALNSADPSLVAQGEEFAHRIGAEVAETVRSRWAAARRNPADVRLELHVGSAHRMAAAMVLSRVVANELDHRVYVRVDRMSAIEICPAEATSA